MKTRHRSARPFTRIAAAWSLAIALLLLATSAHAVLFRVGPVDAPSPPGTGFPFWYQDTNGLALDLCLPANQFQLDNGVCLILPPDQDPAAGMNLPIVFPTNFPDEAFWWNTTGVMDIDANNRATLVMALEAAFAQGPVAVNDQVSFGRLRIIVDAPVSGNYTITHPYGVNFFPNVTADARAITFTSDIGIAIGDFHGALQSNIGPFLVPADAPGGNTLPPVTVGGEQFLSDTAAPVFITGSPTGNNFFRVCVDAPGGLDGQGTACMTLDTFTVMGKVHAGPLGSPLNVSRATYSRAGGYANIDVFADATPAPNAAAPALTLFDGIDNTVMPPQVMNGPTGIGQFFGQGIPASSRNLPAAVTVTNTADVPPFSVIQPLVDQVEITRALYDPATGILSITATSSDKGDSTAPAIAPPQLIAIGLPGSETGSEPLASSGGIDPAEKVLTYAIPAPLPPGGPVPPATITVTSSRGGAATEPVTIPLVVPVVTSAGIGASPASPQAPGAQVTFTATSVGGIGPIQYEFRGRRAGTTVWSVAKPYGPSNSYLWTAVGGSWEIQVNARSAGSTSPAEATATIAYVVTTPAVSSITIGASPASPSAPGTSVTFTAANPVGGTAPLQYEFRGRRTGTTEWSVARAYGTSATWTWSAVAGSWDIQVNVRSAGSVAAAEASAVITYVVNNPAVTAVSLGASPASPVAPGTAVTFTASNPVGGVAPIQYEFRGRRVGVATYSVLRGYSTSNTANWTAVAGSYEIQVNARSAGSTAAAEATQTILFTVQ